MARKKGAERLQVVERFRTDHRALMSVRVSEDRDRGHTMISPDEQERKLRMLAGSQGLEVLEVVHEVGISGDGERAEIQRLVQRIKDGEAAWLVVNEVDRLGRDFQDIVDTMYTVINAGGCLLINEPLLDSSSDAGQLLITILGQIARADRMKITRKWSDAQASAWRRGIYPGDLPCGYRNPKPHELPMAEPGRAMPVQVPEEAEAIREAARALIDEGISWPMAAAIMTKRLGRGGKTRGRKQGGGWVEQWSAKGVRALFANPMLVGEVSFKGQGIERDGCEPILSHSDFETINGHRTTSTTASQNDPTHLGAKTLRCYCGYVLHRRVSGKGKNSGRAGVVTYYCRNPSCEKPVRNLAAEPVEEALERLAREAAERDVERMMGEGAMGRTVADVNADLAEARTRKRRFALLLAQDPEDEDLIEAHETIKAEIRALETERRSLDNQGGARMGLLVPEVWSGLTAAQKIAQVRAVLDVVMVDPDEDAEQRLWAFGPGAFPYPLPSKGRSVLPRRFDPTLDVPAEVRAAVTAGSE